MNPFPRAWLFLTRPHHSITDIEQKRQSKLLASLIVTLVIMSGLASVALIWKNDNVIIDTVKFLWLAMSVTLGLYFLNRNGRYHLSASIFVGYTFLITFLMPPLTKDPSWLWFTPMSLILSAMLLSSWATTFLFFLGLVFNLLEAAIYPLTATFTNFATIIVYNVMAPLIIVFMNHRLQLEKERQQELQSANEALQRSEIILEQKVIARTRDLKVAADVARQITTVLDLTQLLPELVEKTKAAFDLYFVSIFLYRPASKDLELVAGSGIAGQQMLTEGRAFHLDTTPSLVAKAARERQSIIINDISQETAHAANPYLPHTKSEAVLPMLIGDELIGILGLQAHTNDRFSPNDVEIFNTLAEQIAIAVKNAQLFATQTQHAEALRQADKMKSQFLASMSHELRTPLNAIINFTEMVALGMIGPVNQEQVSLLEQSLDSSKHLLNLINDVLDISKIQAGKLTLFVEENINIYAELETAVTMIQPMLQGKPVQLIQDIDDHLPLLCGDKRRIRQILLNLLTNAAKFTDEGTITLSAKNQGHHVLFAITDTGPGITADLQLSIFEPFIQTPNDLKNAHGTGLGLPITRSLVEAHGGHLWLESEPGDGAAFYVTLPAPVSQNGKQQ